jgi:hypothetical protein
MTKSNIFLNILLLLALNICKVHAQSNRLDNIFFRGNLIVNPSLPNVDNETNVNLLFKSPMNNSVPGLQKSTGFNINTSFSDKDFGGISILKQTSGFLVKQYYLASYALDIRLTEKFYLRNGLAFGFRDLNLDQSIFTQSYSINYGNENDPAILAYTNKPPVFYSSWGTTLYTKKFDMQLVIPNVVNYFQNKDSSYEDILLQFGMGYQMPINFNSIIGDGGSLKLQFAYMKNRLAYQTANIISLGAKINTAQGISGELCYSNTGAINVGFGADILDKYGITLNYIIGGLNSSLIYGGSGQILFGFNFKMPKKNK